MLDYNKIYNIYEIFTLLENMPKNTKVLCLQNQMNYVLIDGNLIHTDKDNNCHWINVQCNTKELINLTFKVVKEEEEEEEDESKSEWVECDLQTALGLLTYNIKIKMFDKIYYNNSSLKDFVEDYKKISSSKETEIVITLDKNGICAKPKIDLYYLKNKDKEDLFPNTPFEREYKCKWIGDK